MNEAGRPYRVLILYTELAQYFLSSLDRFLERNKAEVLIVRWPLNKEAPFEFQMNESNQVLDRTDLNDTQLMEVATSFRPDVVLCSGWMDKGYVAVCMQLKKAKIPTITFSDTKWTGSWRQRLSVLRAPFVAKRAFSDMWVTGQSQARYAKRLGFEGDAIHMGAYCAQVSVFKKQAEMLDGVKVTSYPKRFLYMGRYIASKGIVELVDAFIELQKEAPNDWELWCCGTGELDPLPVAHQKVKHFGFVQVKDVPDIIEKTGVFVLPSHYEPWGVVVHEMALSGMPMLLSSEIGAAEMFLEEGRNGFQFQSGNSIELKRGLKRFMELDDAALRDMGQESAAIGLRHDNDNWAEVLEAILKRKLA